MDNSTPEKAKEYDSKIEKTIPFYSEFYKHTIDLVKSLPVKQGKWLDTGCGTGEFVLLAAKEFSEFQFSLCDPSEAMLTEAQQKLTCQQQITNFCICGSQQLNFADEFVIVTAIQAHHYMEYKNRLIALENCYNALKNDGVFIFFENFAPNSEYTKNIVLDRWGRYQKHQGKTDAQVADHIARYGKNYFPITINEHFELLKKNNFRYMEIFWLSYMQVGIYAVK